MAVVLAQEAKPSTFEELIDGFGTRCCYIDGKYYISIRDLIIAVSRENPKEDKESWEKACVYASNTWQTIKKNTKLTEELGYSLKTFQFEGQGEKVQDVVVMEGIIDVISTLPGKLAMQKRRQAIKIMNRYLVGDMRLVGEIEANAKSDHHIAQMLRANMGSSAVSLDDEEERAKKRRRMLKEYNLRLHGEGLEIMNRMHESEAVLAAAEAQRVVGENERMAAETERIKNENKKIAEEQESHENTRAINPTKKLRCDLGTVYNKFLSGVLNSKSFMFKSLRHNKLRMKTQMMSDGGDILNMEQVAFHGIFKEFLEVNDYKEVKQKPKENDFKKMMLGAFSGIIHNGMVQGFKCYLIDYNQLRVYFADGKNNYDAEIVF